MAVKDLYSKFINFGESSLDMHKLQQSKVNCFRCFVCKCIRWWWFAVFFISYSFFYRTDCVVLAAYEYCIRLKRCYIFIYISVYRLDAPHTRLLKSSTLSYNIYKIYTYRFLQQQPATEKKHWWWWRRRQRQRRWRPDKTSAQVHNILCIHNTSK